MGNSFERLKHSAVQAVEVLGQAAPLIIEGLSARTRTGVDDFFSSEPGIKAKNALTQFRIAADVAQIALPVLFEETVERPAAAAMQAVSSEANHRLQMALSKAESQAGEMLAKAVRSRRIEARNLPQGRMQRREAAQAAMGPADQREMRQIFGEDPAGVVQALQLPDPREIEADFHVQARVRKGEEYDPLIPLAEQDSGIGRIEYDPKDRRIKELRELLGVPIHPMVLKNLKGQDVQVYDWVRLERDDGSGRNLTGPLEPRVTDGEGNFVRQAEYRTVMVPNVAGAAARAELREMVHELGEDLTSPKTVAIIARLDTLAESQRDGFSPRFMAKVFSLARTTDYSPKEVVDRCLQGLDPFLNSGYFPNIDLRQPSSLELAGKPRWKKLLIRKKPIRVTRFKPRKS